MAMKTRPVVTAMADGGKYWENTYDSFYLKAYVPATDIDGQVNNYSFRAPLLMVFEENRQSMAEAIAFARKSGLERIASRTDSSVLFIYPACEGGWANASPDLYAAIIAEIKMNVVYEDGICSVTNFFTRQFEGYFVRGAIFRADIYSFGASADYVARNLIRTLHGEYLWGPGEITPAMLSMENLSVEPVIERTDIGIISVGNSESINRAFARCRSVLIKDKADYFTDFYGFVRRFKMWCGKMETEPDFDEMNMTEEAGCITVSTSEDNRARYKGTKEHKIGYFAYYNNGLFDNGPVPLLVGFHGGGDSTMYLTFVSGWYAVAHKYGFLYVALENHMDITATETVEFIEKLKARYPIDAKRIYATGFSMGSCKTWELYQEYPTVFAGMAPASALFPVGDNPLSMSHGKTFNQTEPVPMFYSGGEMSPLPELPCQAETAFGRIQYLAKVNKLKARFDSDYADKENWKTPVWCTPGDRVEKMCDESRGSVLTVHYYDSEDGVCRTALASIDNQMHECRQHTNEAAWQFISQFTR